MNPNQKGAFVSKGSNATPVDPSDYPHEGTFCTWCGFFLFLWFTPLSVVFFYHAAPTTIITLFIIWNLITLGPWAFHAGGSLASDKSGPVLTLTLFVSVFMSFLGGVRCYYHHAQPMRQLALARHYTGVYPELPGKSLPDAAYIEFVGNATIDFENAMSYQSLDSGHTTFCVAPVKSAQSTGRHDFWAIGVDCCDMSATGKARFQCYDAGEPDVKAGWVLPTQYGDALYSTLGRYVSPSESRRDLFTKAVEKAEAVHGIVSPGDKAVFLRWTKTKKEDIAFAEMIDIWATMITFGAILGGLSFVMTRLYQRFKAVRKIHRRMQKAGQEDEDDEDMTARLHTFMAEQLEDARDSDMAGTINRFGNVHEGVVRLAKAHKPPPDPKDMCLMSIAIPYIILMLAAILSTFSPCARLGHLILAPFYCINFIGVIALLATPGRAVNGLFLLLCCSAGHYIGMCNYRENMFHYCSTSDRRTYHSMSPAVSSEKVWDAGWLEFDESAMLSTHHSVGFLYQGTTYCAAPVIARNVTCKKGLAAVHGQVEAAPGANVTGFWQEEEDQVWKLAAMEKKRLDTVEEFSESQERHTTSGMDAPSFMQRRSGLHQSKLRAAVQHKTHRGKAASVPASQAAAGGCQKPAPKRIEFWATGTDCCDARGKFWCDGADVAGAHQAVVVRAFGDEDAEVEKIPSDRGRFFQAINQAVATFELPRPDRPVLVRWGSSAKQLQQDWRQRAISIIGVTALASLIVILVIGIGSYFFSRHLRRQELADMQEYQKRNPGADDAAGYDGAPSPRPSLPPAQGGGGGRAGEGGMSW